MSQTENLREHISNPKVYDDVKDYTCFKCGHEFDMQDATPVNNNANLKCPNPEGCDAVDMFGKN